jgi:hypothetical protein
MNKHRLVSDLDPAQVDELGDLGELEAELRAFKAPEPDTAALLARLTAVRQSAVREARWRGWWRLARTQTALLTARFWWATFLVIVIGVVLVASYGGAMLVAYGLCSPVLAVAGTAYLFRPETRTLYEFEVFGGYSLLELLYMRLLMVLGYTSAIALVLLLAATTQGLEVVLWRLVIIWFGPMVGLTGLALYATVRWNAFAGAALPMGVWAAMIALGWHNTTPELVIDVSMSALLTAAISQSNSLLAAALAGLVGGAALIWQAGVLVDRDDPA